MEHLFDKPFVDGHHVLFVYKGHLQVDLGEFGLAVGPQVLVPEATGDLHVPVITGKHQDLFVQLGGLGQGKEFAGVHPGGHQVVPGAFGGGFDEDGGLNLQKPVVVIVVTGHLDDLVPHHDGVLHHWAAQVQVAVF